MNRSKIEWCDHTWNPITGCRHNCPYCYARKNVARFSGDARLNRMAKMDYYMESAADGSGEVYFLDGPMLNETGKPLIYPFGFEPTYHRYRLDTLDKLKMGNNIFVGAMTDMFGSWVPDQWIKEVFAECVKRPIHNYLFLTKNPARYSGYGVPVSDNMWYGTSVTREAEMSLVRYLPVFCNTFISIEPVLEDLKPAEHSVMFQQVKWVIIGAETGKQKNKVIPEADWVREIAAEADKYGVPVFMKDSLAAVIGEENMRREFTKQLQKNRLSPKMDERLYGVCARCSIKLRKSDMIALLARQKRGEQPKQFGFVCWDCFGPFCRELDADMPFKGSQEGAGE